MSSGTPWRIILVTEGPSDFRRIRILIDHFLQEHGMSGASLDGLRRFEGLNGEPYIQIKKIPELARAEGLDRRYSSYGPNKGDGGTLRKMHQVLQKKKLLTPESVILWVRDDDGHDARREEAKEARKALPISERLLFAIASECGEAWVIAGWRPTTQADKSKLKAWRKNLGFAPHAQPNRLSHKEGDPRGAKAVFKDLFDGEEEQEATALKWAARPNNQASSDCGLREFRDEFEAWLAKR